MNLLRKKTVPAPAILLTPLEREEADRRQRRDAIAHQGDMALCRALALQERCREAWAEYHQCQHILAADDRYAADLSRPVGSLKAAEIELPEIDFELDVADEPAPDPPTLEQMSEAEAAE